MTRLALRAAISVGALVAVLYAVGLGVYAATSVAPDVPTQPASADEAERVVDRLGLERAYPYPHRFVATPHGRMHYVDQGAGPVLLCLHGNPTWSFLYRHVIDGLSDRARVVAPDLIGFGLSEKPFEAEDYTLEGHIQDVSTLVESLDLRDVTLVVHGWGAVIGGAVAQRHPDRIRALVVMNGLAPGDGREDGVRVPPVVRLARLPVVGEELVLGLGVLHRAGIRSGFARKERRRPDVLRAYRVVQANWDERAAALAFQRLAPPDASPEVRELLRVEDRFLRSFDKPALLIWGARDRVLGRPVLDAWRERLPHARVLEIPDAGHLVPEDAPGEVTAEIRAFLDRIGG